VAAEQPDVSIIVINYRTEDLSARAVADARAAAGELSTEAILVDNGATADSAARLRTGVPDAEIVELTENRGFAAGVNAGVARAKGRFLLLLNSDAFMRGHALASLAAHLEAHPRAGVVAPRLLHDDGSLQINAYRRFPGLLTLFFEFCAPLHLLHGRVLHPHTLPRTRFTSPVRVAHVMGAAMLVRREAFRDAGPFDEVFFLYLEETEWQRRVAAAGWEIWVEPTAETLHLEKGSSDAQVFSPHYLESAKRYFHPWPAARLLMRLGARISVLSAALAARARPGDPRFPKLEMAFRDVLRRV
jgi:N-acetylglucosaminyl-diphospho-decaprenol L-rhamnosyltransferase